MFSNMFRKTLLAFAALAAIGTAVSITDVIPAASAQGFNNHRQHWRPAVRFHGPSYGYASCYVRRVTHTPFGPRVHWVNICY